MIRIICVYKSGGPYDARYVIALKNAIDLFIAADTIFYCLTNEVDEISALKHYGIYPIEIKDKSLQTWWNKIELFRPDLKFDGTTIYFDLDVVIMTNIDLFVRVCQLATHPLMLRSSDKMGERHNWPSSSIMSWKGKDMNRVYHAFNSMDDPYQVVANHGPQAGQRTDQGFIRKFIQPNMIQDYLPDGYVVFKNQILSGTGNIEGSAIINWTGNPRLHALAKPRKNGSGFNDFGKVWEERTKFVKRYTTHEI